MRPASPPLSLASQTAHPPHRPPARPLTRAPGFNREQLDGGMHSRISGWLGNDSNVAAMLASAGLSPSTAGGVTYSVLQPPEVRRGTLGPLVRGALPTLMAAGSLTLPVPSPKQRCPLLAPASNPRPCTPRCSPPSAPT
jgi:hypothetical protein